MIRTDGYFSRDSGWWYVVSGASIDSIDVYYPNWTTSGEGPSTSVLTLTNEKTDSLGMWRNLTLIFTDDSFPMGRYKVKAQVSGPTIAEQGDILEGFAPIDLSGIVVGDDSGGDFLTVFFDLVGPLNVTMDPIPDVSDNTDVTISGTVYQPNGRVFNSSEVLGIPGFGSYWVNISVLQPNLTISRLPYLTSDGTYSVTYTATSVGKHYVIANVETDVGNEAERGKHTSGRAFQEFVVTGTWPEVSMAFAGSPLRVLLALALGLYLKRRADHGL
jgi:hypothetical protein